MNLEQWIEESKAMKLTTTTIRDPLFVAETARRLSLLAEMADEMNRFYSSIELPKRFDAGYLASFLYEIDRKIRLMLSDWERRVNEHEQPILNGRER